MSISGTSERRWLGTSSRTMQQCGFCAILSDLLRRALCIRSRRGSSDSYYRELGDQDTLKIEDKASDLSDDAEELNQEPQPAVTLTLPSPPALPPSPSPSPSPSPLPLPPSPQPLPENPELASMAQQDMNTGRFLTIHKRRRKRLLTRSLINETGQLDDLHQGQVQRILDQSAQWKFNAFILENVSGGRCLPVLCLHLFHTYGLMAFFKLDVAKTWKLFSLIEEGYHSTNPYHNSVHAADVTQAMHCFLQQKQIRDHLEPLDIMTSLLAAIAHDLDHPGVNQPFLVATSNHLAALYRNTSVLENHHWRTAISCLIQSGVLDHMEDLQATLKKRMSSLILATDITRQQEYLSRFKNHLDTHQLDMKNFEHRHLVLQIALKCADISNPCRPWEISRKWSLKVCEEFFRQGDYERRLKLPVTALCDRHTTSIPKIQTGFFKFVVTPLINEWHRFLQNDLSEQMRKNLLYNQRKWEMLLAREIAEETRTEISDADVVDDDLETYSGTNVSGSSEMLLPPRRSSLNPTKQGAFKEQLRRFSVPLNVFQDTKYKNRDKSVAESHSRDEKSPVGSEHSLHSQLSVRGRCEPKQSTSEKALSTENLLADSSITSITTPVQASRLKTVLKGGSTWKLVRQQTFPPLETAAREHALACRPIYTSNEDAIGSSRYTTDLGDRIKFDVYKKDELSSILRGKDTDKTDMTDASENKDNETHNIDKGNRNLVTKSASGKKEPALGSQLRDNLFSIQLGALESDQLLQRRKSMPAAVVAFTPKEKKKRELPVAVPQFLRRTLSSKESWTRRRGSAPSPVAPSELRGLAALGPLGHSANGGRRKPSLICTCQQWLAKTTYNVQERPIAQLPRRSSLPVEVFRLIEELKSYDTE